MFIILMSFIVSCHVDIVENECFYMFEGSFRIKDIIFGFPCDSFSKSMSYGPTEGFSVL